MVDRMEELNKIHRERINNLNISQDKTTHQYKSRSDDAKPQGELKQEIYDLYYDISNTITTAQATDPHDSENANYNQERIFEFCERNAPFITVSNDGSDTLFVIASHKANVAHFSAERPVYPGENKVYKNVYELRLRSPTAGLPYRVTEYHICCTSSAGTTSARGSPLQAAININTAGDNTIIAAPATVGQRIRIVNLFFVVTAAVGVILKSGAGTNLTGVMSFAANGGMGFNGDFNPLQMAVNQAFVINLNGNVQVSGFVLYYVE